jgi:hypothetical protein
MTLLIVAIIVFSVVIGIFGVVEALENRFRGHQ